MNISFSSLLCTFHFQERNFAGVVVASVVYSQSLAGAFRPCSYVAGLNFTLGLDSGVWRQMFSEPTLISYDLAISRLGALIAFKSPDPDRPLFMLAPEYKDSFRISERRRFVKDLFRSQCEHILASDAYLGIFLNIAKLANSVLRIDKANDELNIERKRLDTLDADDRDISPDIGVDELEEHLIAQFPPRFIRAQIADREWSVRIRASATACAIEDKGRLPKLWWTFEAVPTDPDPDNRPAEKETAAVFQFAESFEEFAFTELSRAYFDALKGKVGLASDTFDFEPVVGKDKVSILFADSKSFSYESLIDAMGYQKLTPGQIADPEAEGLAAARNALTHFRSLVQQSTPPDGHIDFNEVELACPPMPKGLDALTAMFEDEATGSKAIIGVAQLPIARSSLDYTHIGRDLRIADNDEQRLRFQSASKQITARLAEIESINQERRRLSADARSAHAAPSI